VSRYDSVVAVRLCSEEAIVLVPANVDLARELPVQVDDFAEREIDGELTGSVACTDNELVFGAIAVAEYTLKLDVRHLVMTIDGAVGAVVTHLTFRVRS
jgi:hypothetical protein